MRSSSHTARRSAHIGTPAALDDHFPSRQPRGPDYYLTELPQREPTIAMFGPRVLRPPVEIWLCGCLSPLHACSELAQMANGPARGSNGASRVFDVSMASCVGGIPRPTGEVHGILENVAFPRLSGHEMQLSSCPIQCNPAIARKHSDATTALSGVAPMYVFLGHRGCRATRFASIDWSTCAS